MGQIAEDTLNGLACQYCGVWMPEVEEYIMANDISAGDIIGKKENTPFSNPHGYPRTCPDCEEEHGKSEWE